MFSASRLFHLSSRRIGPAFPTFVRRFAAKTPLASPTPPPEVDTPAKRQEKKVRKVLTQIGMVVVVLICARYYYMAMFSKEDPIEVFEPDPAEDEKSAPVSSHPVQQSQRNPVVFLDISIDDEPAGRIYIRLRGDMVPVTAENFLYMCQNVNPGRTLENTGFHRVVSGAFIQGGLLRSPSQPVPEYVVGEGFELQPDGPYWVGMAESTSNPDPNHSQFFITTNATPTLNGKHVIFGRVIEGYSVVHAIENRFAIAGGASAAIRVTHTAEVATEARMEFIRGSLTPNLDPSSVVVDPAFSISPLTPHPPRTSPDST